MPNICSTVTTSHTLANYRATTGTTHQTSCSSSHSSMPTRYPCHEKPSRDSHFQ
jgi:hypothetical protein